MIAVNGSHRLPEPERDAIMVSDKAGRALAILQLAAPEFMAPVTLRAIAEAINEVAEDLERE